MGNTLITPQLVAKEALAILRNNCVYKDLVHTDYSGDFVNHVGDTINVRVPAALSAKDFTSTIDKQDITESYVPVKLDKFKDVSVAVTSKEWTLSLVDFGKQVIEPAMAAIGEQIDKDDRKLPTFLKKLVIQYQELQQLQRLLLTLLLLRKH